MAKTNFKSNKHSPTASRLASYDLGCSKELMLRYYLEEGQPASTDRLVRGQPIDKVARKKELKKIVGEIDRMLKVSSNGQSAKLPKAAIAVAPADGAPAVQDRKASEA